MGGDGILNEVIRFVHFESRQQCSSSYLYVVVLGKFEENKDRQHVL